MAFSLTRADSGRRVGWVSLVGLLLVPLLIAAGFLYASWNSSHRLDHVQAAIVNLDEAVKIGDQTVPLGRQLAGGLVTSGDDAAKTDQNYTWVLSDEEDAAAGLRSGTYAAVVTIPKNFSSAATSYSKDAADAERATIAVQTSATGSIVDPGLSRAIVSAAVASLNTQLTSTYLENVYVGFNDLSKQFSTVADAAGKLNDGASKLSAGVDQTDAGVARLASGMRELSTGGQELATNVDTYAAGVGQAATGLNQLAAGTKALPGQVRTLADGSQGIATGVSKLSDGAGSLAEGAAKLNAGLPRLASGSSALASGADRVADGAEASAAGATTLATGASGVASGLGQYRQAMAGLPDTITCEQAGVTDEGACTAFTAGVSAASQAAVQGLADQGSRPGLITGATGVAGGARALSAGLNGTDDQPGLAGGARGIADGAQQLATGINGTREQPGLAAGVSGLSSGATQLAAGAERLAGGSQQLATGTDRLADGLPKITSGIAAAAGGVQQLATGGTQLAAGVRTYTAGVTASADGTQQLSTGIGKLATGASGLAGGTKQLADGLAKGADAVPTYTAGERENLSTVVASPVDQPEASTSGVFSDVSAIAYLLAIALWVGALASFLVLGTGVRQAWSSTQTSAWLALRGLAPAAVIGAVQAVVLGAVVSGLLDLSAGRTAGLIGLAVFAAATFVVVNYALVGLFGGVGRFVSVALLVASAAGMLLSAVPAFFTALRPVLPLTPAMEGLKAVAADGSGVGSAVAGLLGWFVIALVASVLAVVRRRQLNPTRVLEAVRA